MSSRPILRVFQCDVQVSHRDLGLTRDRYTRAILRNRLSRSIRWRDFGTYTISNSLQNLIDDFAERNAPGAIANLSSYFGRRIVAGYTRGGRRATSRPLLYTRDQLKPSERGIGAVGEGVAGYYLEEIEGLLFELRPFDVSPDLIFRSATGDVILCEVKTSLERTIQRNYLVTVAISLLDILAKTRFIRSGRYIAYVIAVKISDLDNFELRRLKLEEV